MIKLKYIPTYWACRLLTCTEPFVLEYKKKEQHNIIRDTITLQ